MHVFENPSVDAVRISKAPQNLGGSNLAQMTHHEVQYFADVVDGACNRR